MNYLALIETSSNQRYIFSTNKLCENVGASELTYQIGTKIVLEVVEAETNLRIYDDDPVELRKNLSDKSKNPEIGIGNPDSKEAGNDAEDRLYKKLQGEDRNVLKKIE
jgi:hypothetical protein